MRSALGLYNLTFPPSFRARITTATPHTSGDNRAVVDNSNPQAPQIRTFSSTYGTAADIGFAFTAVRM